MREIIFCAAMLTLLPGAAGGIVYLVGRKQQNIENAGNQVRQEVRVKTIQHFGADCLRPKFCSQGAVDIFDKTVQYYYPRLGRADGMRLTRSQIRENGLRAVRVYLRNTPKCYCHR